MTLTGDNYILVSLHFSSVECQWTFPLLIFLSSLSSNQYVQCVKRSDDVMTGRMYVRCLGISNNSCDAVHYFSFYSWHNDTLKSDLKKKRTAILNGECHYLLNSKTRKTPTILTLKNGFTQAVSVKYKDSII